MTDPTIGTSEFIPYACQDITDADIAAVVAALRNEMITQGPGVDAFESDLASAVGARHAVVFNSGTAALHAAYFAAGLGPPDIVVTSPITFAATANAALYLGAQVRFVDVDPDSVLLDIDRVPSVDRHHGRVALVPVHLAGHVADMERAWRSAQENDWLVIEDAAHALGSRYTDSSGVTHAVGACTHSHMCCFSFHAVKHITTGEGGAVTTNSDELASRLRRFRSHGITKDPSELLRSEGPWYYEQHDLGFNYRIPDILCALGRSQLTRLGSYVDRRRHLASLYDDRLSQIRDVRLLREGTHCRSAYHLYVVRVPASLRRAVFERLRHDGIGVNVHYMPVYQHPHYRNHGWNGFQLSNADAYYAEAITLPLFPRMSNDDVDRVVHALDSALAQAGPGA
jgi:perosamine synthetase